PMIKTNKAQFAMASIQKTTEREKQVDFSVPYYESIVSVLTLKKDKINKLTDLKKRKIGVQLGSAHEKYAKEDLKTKLGELEIKSYNKIGEMILDLKLARLQGVLAEKSVIKSFEHKNIEIFHAFDSDQRALYHVIFAKNSDLKK